MAGNTATICVQTFRAQWDAGVPMAMLCHRWTITKDQIIRLKDVWELPLRHDRARKRAPIERPPAEEVRASEDSLALAPLVEERASAIRQSWTLEVEHTRRGTFSGSQLVRAPRIISLANMRPASQEPCDDE